MRNRADAGFTLIEIMVALAVFSLAVLALVRLESATARGAGLIDETTVAQLVARNVAVEALTEAQPPAPGLTTGSEANGGRSWNWTRQVSSAGDARVMRVDVAVSNLAGQQVGRITMIRPPSAAAGQTTPVPGATPTPTPTATPPAGGR
ncbi:type II secretion system minor pseudopilin GspI [Sphingomonas sp. KR1UV-12]|uniref:Type II secretion system protein I n=1 Tax=Sphingomonas aurea TaxID=3063994 RepID=A0ABT9EG78_9SPHN|nr:type II secretion system minor pseudopilin GspI [Sphingomonas sp. KR1UV-12]MDP1025977.1 type II secretion system minor pseudopilin GspI [Sphingomonas sp. KR1UV-12]